MKAGDACASKTTSSVLSPWHTLSSTSMEPNSGTSKPGHGIDILLFP